MEKFNLCYHVIDRCNKNCTACGHYAPLASRKDKGVGVEDFRRDLGIAGFLRPCIDRFYITGGEPTLHGHLQDLLAEAAGWFGNVWLMTNGLDMDFLTENAGLLEELGVRVIMTNYDMERCDKAAGILGRVEWYSIPSLDNAGGVRERFNSGHLSRKAVNASGARCMRGECVHLKYGKLYLCQIAANLHLLKNRFGRHVSEFTEDGAWIDLEKTRDAREVADFVFNAFPELCRHCNEPFFLDGSKDNSVPLGNSRLEISEWIED